MPRIASELLPAWCVATGPNAPARRAFSACRLAHERRPGGWHGGLGRWVADMAIVGTMLVEAFTLNEKTPEKIPDAVAAEVSVLRAGINAAS